VTRKLSVSLCVFRCCAIIRVVVCNNIRHHLAPIPGARSANSSACCPSECKCVDKIPLVKSSSQYSRSCSISKITETPRPLVISRPVECTSEPITKYFYTFRF
jgi:hypothetical protein